MRQRGNRKRAHGQIRPSQLISTFGPGAMMDLPNHSVIIGGLDSWSPLGDEIAEPRLAQKLSQILGLPAIQLRLPPPEQDDPTTPTTGINAFQFPEWFITQAVIVNLQKPNIRSRLLVHRNALTNGKFVDQDRNKYSVVPIRFVRACPAGHIGDIDWYAYVHREASQCRRQLWIDEYGTSGDLSEVFVRCECKKERSMVEAIVIQDRALGKCDGSRLWLGPTMKERCNEPNRLLIRTASNAYFPQIMSVISLPDRDEKIKIAVDSVWDFLSEVEDIETLKYERKKAKVNAALDGITDEEVMKELDSRRDLSSILTKTVKQAELETLISSSDEIGEDRPDGIFYARSFPANNWACPWMSPIEKVVLVHRLREVAALFGFTRFEPQTPDAEGEFEMNVRRADIACDTAWLPAIENKGEGVFLQFNREAIQSWLAQNDVQNRGRKLQTGFDCWKEKHPGTHRIFPGLPYIMLHSFSHLLITAMSLECGYPTSSIRERIYAMQDAGYGVLLYTGSADAEGTLGGLIEAGRRIHEHIYHALEMGELCSNDPVCSQHDPVSTNEHRFLHGAACHGCLLIAETSCEQYNDFLDRALVIPTLENLEIQFFPWPVK